MPLRYFAAIKDAPRANVLLALADLGPDEWRYMVRVLAWWAGKTNGQDQSGRVAIVHLLEMLERETCELEFVADMGNPRRG